MNDPEVLICHTAIAFYWPRVASRIEDCARCGTQVWVAISSPKAETIVCMKCGLAMIQEDPEAVIMPPTKEQMAELRRFSGAGEALIK